MTKVIYDKYENSQHVKHEVTEISEQPAQEPVAWGNPTYNYAVHHNVEQPAQEHAYQVGEIVNPYGSNIKIKQPAQEPVNVGTSGTFPLPKVRYESYQWQGLSDDEIEAIWHPIYLGGGSGDDNDFARAIEQALRNKNEL